MSKTIVLCLISLILAGIFGYALSVKLVILAVIFGLLWSATFILKSILIEDWRVGPFWILGEAAAMVFWFFQSVAWPLLLAAGAVITLVLIAGHRNASQAVKNTFQILFFPIGKLVSTKIITAAAILLTIVSLPSYNIENPKLARQFFNKTIANVEKFLPSDITNLPLQARAQIYEQAYSSTVGKLFTLPPAIQKAIIIGIALLVFLSIKSILYFAGWLALLIAYLGYKILRSAGFFKITVENRSKEVIIL